MTVQTIIPTITDAETAAVELEGLALAMRIVVADYLGDRSLAKCNALDALSAALHAKARTHGRALGQIDGGSHV